MRYLTLIAAIGFTGAVSACTSSYLGSASTFEPGYRYSGYGPSYLGQTGGVYGFQPGAAGGRQMDRPLPEKHRLDR